MPSRRKSTATPVAAPVPTSPVRQFFDALMSSYPARQKESRRKKFNPDVLVRFCKNMGYDISEEYCQPGPELAEACLKICEEATMDPVYLVPLKRPLPLGVTFAELCYPDQPFELKVFVTIYTAVIIYLDDAITQTPDLVLPQLREYLSSFSQGGLEQPVLALMHRYLTVEARKIWGPVGSAAVGKATLDFYLGLLIEAKFPNGLQATKTSARFPAFLRYKTGASEAYAFFLFPDCQYPEEDYMETFLPAFPDIIEVTNGMNDVLSFYKECVVGTEWNTYFPNMARILGRDPIAVLEETCDHVVRRSREVLSTLSGKPNARRAFEIYLKGFVMWHVMEKRYRLDEVGLHFKYASPSSATSTAASA
ncbi:isoprenoid synthase domain-containing protein [Sphaerosporella brunnea]|uniref:Isoprenoid synthase domain-containing protein n=1 Tax=Sphaerosporella brunnea TaxID=1250544 RepID=A0A5J5EMA8_9PEZI|nr:isoprenoid synthase domain-containing protein [Sphaerosporella brunnea]